MEKAVTIKKKTKLVCKNTRVFDLVPGDVVGRNIYSDSGNLLIDKDTPLTPEFISKLERWSVLTVPILTEEEVREEAGGQLPAVVARFAQVKVEAEKAARMQKTMAHGARLRKQTLQKTKDILHNYRRKDSASPMEHVQHIVAELIGDSIGNNEIVTTLTAVRHFDSYLYSHSLNVCVLSLLVGENLALSEDDLHLLGQAALLHDIGMTVIPSEIYVKQDALSDIERAQIERHPINSADIIETMPDADIPVLKAIYQHHEREDGSGYPKGIKGSKITPLAKILAVVDSYDAMVSERHYRSRLLPYQALREIVSLAGATLDRDVVAAFTNNMSLYPLGSVVRLNSNELGVTIQSNVNAPLRPVIKLVRDSYNNVVPNDLFIDLAKDRSVYISEAIFNDDILQELVP